MRNLLFIVLRGFGVDDKIGLIIRFLDLFGLLLLIGYFMFILFLEFSKCFLFF